MLPKLFDFDSDKMRQNFLNAYANTYIKEEIQLEQIVRNLPGFRKFLQVAAQMNGEPLNYSAIGKDIGSDHTVVRNYYDILEDTLIGFRLPPYDYSFRRQQRKSAKFYFIDTGIKRAIEKMLTVPLQRKSFDYGKAFEHFLICEIYKLCHYRNLDESLSYVRTKDDLEVDLVIERPGKTDILIEIKSTNRISESHARPLNSLCEGKKELTALLLSQDPIQKKFGSVTCLFWKDFFKFWDVI
jgi:uncharacterized protein